MRSTKDDAARMRVRLAPGIHLRGGEENGAQVVLVCPEGNVQLNSVAAAILGLCDGSRDRGQVVAEVLQQDWQPRALRGHRRIPGRRRRAWLDPGGVNRFVYRNWFTLPRISRDITSAAV